jgi:DNA invertase Pin-like site-specific DNA recombinase
MMSGLITALMRIRAARDRGRQGGRPKKLNQDKRQLTVDLYRGRKHSLKQICEMVGISKPTLYKYVDVNRRPHLET